MFTTSYIMLNLIVTRGFYSIFLHRAVKLRAYHMPFYH